MQTRIFPIDGDPEKIADEAAGILRAGGIVAFPTETVYGLGADAFNAAAVAAVYRVKGRAADNPLIFHISGWSMLKELAVLPRRAEQLVREFWPGPLTLVCKSRLSPEFTFGLDTVAVRMPDNMIALKLIERLGRPVAAPSANLSGTPSGTSVEHVIHDFSGRIEAIIDGGQTVIGIESTVLDVTGDTFTLLRPGAVGAEQLAEFGVSVTLPDSAELLKRSPGTRYRHYAPAAQLVLVARGGRLGLPATAVPRAFMGLHQPAERYDRLFLFGGVREYGRLLFATLRHADALGMRYIVAELPDEKGFGIALRDRLRKAAG